MILREIEEDLRKWIGKEKILIIRGARQIGKTTLIQKLKTELEQKGNTVFYFTMDRYDHLEQAEDPVRFFEYLKDKGLNAKKKNFLFIDEFQYIKEAGRFLKILFDEHKKYLQIIVTGSSSLEISKNSEYLTGRKIDFQMGTLSFKELYQYRELNGKFESLDIGDTVRLENFYNSHKSKLEFNFFDYIKFGGYPEVVLEDQISIKKEIIREITNTYLKKDITAFMKIADVKAFNDLIEILASQTGNLINISELASTLKINRATVEKYIEILEATYVFKLVKPFSSNIRKVISKTPKVYIKDFGMQKVALNYFPQDENLISGAEVENFVLKHLDENCLTNKIQFYRTSAGSEIDFIVESEKGVDCIEVKYSGKINSRSKMPANVGHFMSDHGNLRFDKRILITREFLKIDNHNKEYFIPAALFPLLSFYTCSA